ncbi:MAG: hypothetical protein IH948_00725 [Bacteroidetes bacterium]|nr:hypothetical protein [Bacteroidota bacterium]
MDEKEHIIREGANLMENRSLFRSCVKDAIRIGRRYMIYSPTGSGPTQQEWELALVLFKHRLKDDKK